MPISYQDAKSPSRYVMAGYKSRSDYLETLSLEYGVDLFIVENMADVLGPNEDFDGLVSMLQEEFV